jgi:hypothetical protein
MTSPKGAVHDLGYKRYVGSRRPASTRWRVIMRNQIAMGWKTWWRYKLALFLAVITSFVSGALLYFFTNKVIRGVGASAGTDMVLRMGDGVVPMSLEWYARAAFVLSLTLGATIVATDTQSGAFTFYFVRSIRPRDYVLGKLAGYGLLVATIVVAGPFLIACLRLGLSADTTELVDNLAILPKILAVGLLTALVYTTIPLAISSVINNRRYALALWAAYYVVGMNIFRAVGLSSHSDILSSLHVGTSLTSVAYDLFDFRVLRGTLQQIPLTTAVGSLLVQSGAALALLWYQVSRDHRSGVGGGS